ncbi:DUF222 domain-containing protein [Phytoactinopolyspora halotolerans]|uniref:DUF222 domain-containing protein n=1 Tax=Phytoactinopolyspora halotolerans TaxID=1981512 RepID=A0A6L9SB48_9ACTN|nr:DUF222 domain-containing protein [Phytoactinopolyspora halotolerans]NEE02329.1 DUF222 domain-containing protein [Phytoactinopolyspora halotolerans]
MSTSASDSQPPSGTRGLAATAPGPALGLALEECQPRQLDDYDVVDAIVACERQMAHLQAVQARMVQELSGRENYAFCVACEDTEVDNAFHTHDRADAVGQELSPALTWTPNEAKNHAGLAIELVEEHRSVLRALEQGRISWNKARIIVRGVAWLHDAWLQAEVEDRLLEDAPGMTERQLHRRLNRMLSEADPDTARKRRAEGRKKRRVCPPVPDDDVTGIASMTLVGPAEDLAALYTAVDAGARALRAAGDSRNLDQLRFDLLCQVGWNALATGVLAGPEQVRLAHRHGRPATVNVTVPITTLGTGRSPPRPRAVSPRTRCCAGCSPTRWTGGCWNTAERRIRRRVR